MNKKILIADDSSVIQNLAKKIFMQLNYDIMAARNGKEALNKLEGEDFDVVLMDINMPEMDGMEATRQIRNLEHPEKSKIPIIAISGNVKNYTLEDFKEAGINEFLPKPLDFDKLVEKVREYTN